MRNSNGREPDTDLAGLDRDLPALRSDIDHRPEVDLGHVSAEPGRDDSRISFDGKPRRIPHAELHCQARCAQRGVSTELGARAVGVQIDELDGGDARWLEENDSVSPNARTTSTD